MSNVDKLYYKICREQAGLTQRQACDLLGIAEEATLSRYENGHAPVSQELVAAMVKVYRTTTLAWWYIRYTNPDLALHLPDPPPMSTDGDVMLRLELAEDDLTEMRRALKTIFRSGEVSCEEAERLKIKAGTFRKMASKFMQIAGYLEERKCCC